MAVTTATLRSLMDKAGMSDLQVAAAVGTSVSRVRDWRLGITAPGMRNLSKLAYALGEPVEDVVRALEETRRRAERGKNE